jgi:hypothetical protein
MGVTMFAVFMVIVLFMEDSIPSIPSALAFDEVFERVDSVVLDARTDEALLGNVLKVLPFQDKYIVLDSGTRSRLLIFDMSGEFVGPLGRFGNGPGEYNNASDIAVYDNHIFVIDNLPGKILIYNENFEPTLYEPFRKWTRGSLVNASSFLGFVPSEEGLLFGNIHTAKPSDWFAALVSKTGSVRYLAKGPEILRKASFVEGGGLIHDNVMYLMKPLDSTLHRYDLNGKALGKQRIAKVAWPVSTLEGALESIGNDLPWESKKFSEYAWNHLSVQSLTRIGDQLLADYGAFIIVFNLDGAKPTPVTFKHESVIVGNPEGQIIYAVQNGESDATELLFYTLKPSFVAQRRQ